MCEKIKEVSRMLSWISFSNFKSFKDDTMFELTPASINEHNETLIKDTDNESFLPLAVIYGPNGGGKTTVLESIRFLTAVVLKPIVVLKVKAIEKNEKIKDAIENVTFDNKYYRFDEAYAAKPSCFDLLFRTKTAEYRYQLSILNNEIIEENLYGRKINENDAKIIFERNVSDIYLGDMMEGINVDKVNTTIPLLSHISISYDVEAIDDVINWFLNIDYIDYDNPILDKRVLLPADEKSKIILFDMFKEIDIRISDVRVEKDANGNIINLFTQHTTSDGKMVEIDFEDESSGTRKLFSLLPRLLGALRDGKLVVADEMDAKLHPKLLKYIIELFTNRSINKKGAQLLFTSHDLTTMIPAVFRRDEIWFSALNSENSSHLYPLVEFVKENGSKPRNDETYGKQYLEGRYGADPYFRRILDWEEISI